MAETCGALGEDPPSVFQALQLDSGTAELLLLPGTLLETECVLRRLFWGSAALPLPSPTDCSQVTKPIYYPSILKLKYTCSNRVNCHVGSVEL